jgi:hypothetical protein
VWDAPGGNTGTQYLITQVGTTFKILKRDSSVASAVTDVTPSTAAHTIQSLEDASITGVLSDAKIDVVTSSKFCVITGLGMTVAGTTYQELVLILEYRRESDDIVAWFDHIWTRDFFGVQDSRVNGARTTLTVGDDSVMYNLFNQGWWNEASGTSPTKFVLRKFLANAVAAVPEEITSYQTFTTGGVVTTLALDGTGIVSGAWNSVVDPQPVAITVTVNVDGLNHVVTVYGTDSSGSVLVENIAISVVGTYYGSSQFSTVYQVDLTTHASNTGNLTIGTGKSSQLPGDNDNWTLGVYAASATTRTFDTNFLVQAPEGTGKAPVGSYIIPMNYRSSDIAAGGYGRGVYKRHVSNVWYDQTWTPVLSADRSGRPNKLCMFGGRLFTAFTRDGCTGESTNRNSPDINTAIAFSRIINTAKDITACFQTNDPTSPEFNEVLADDGGFVLIQGAGRVLGLRAVASGVVVLATNGVWQITGDLQAGFSATAYQVIKISEVGCVAEDSVVSIQDSLMYVASTGIQMVGPSESGQVTAQSITDGKNNTLFEALDNLDQIKAAYDSAYKRVQFLLYDTAYTSEWCVDAVTGALTTRTFVPGTYGILGYVQYPSARMKKFASGATCPNIGYVLGNGTDVYLGYLRYDDADGAVYSYEDEGGAYGSISEVFVGHVSLGDLNARKYCTYIDTHFERTELQYTVVSGEATVLHESSCLLTGYWEWANTSTSQFKAPAFQAYKYRRPVLAASADGTYDYPYGQSVISARSKLLGYGKTLAIHLQPEDNADCRILGWNYYVGAS